MSPNTSRCVAENSTKSTYLKSINRDKSRNPDTSSRKFEHNKTRHLYTFVERMEGTYIFGFITLLFMNCLAIAAIYKILSEKGTQIHIFLTSVYI